MKRTLEEAIKSSGLQTEIRNIVYHLIRNAPKCEMRSLSQNVSVEFADIDSSVNVWNVLGRFIELSAPRGNTLGAQSAKILKRHVH